MTGNTGLASEKKLPVWKHIVFSILTVGFILALLESSLALFGIQPESRQLDPYVGFVPSIPLYVEKTAADGTRFLVTAENKLHLFNAQSFTRQKAPNTVRVFCIGGSTTYGRPFNDVTSYCGWLRELLNQLDTEKHWEIINAGGISYASYRIATLMDELVQYDPDLFIVYTGHNEFLEQRTYSDLIDRPDWVRSLHASLSDTRIYSAIKTVSRNAAVWHKENNPTSGSLRDEVTAILDKSVGLSAYERDDDLARHVIQHYRYNLERMIQLAESHNAQTVFISPASNLRSSSPFKSSFQTSTSNEQRQQILRLLKEADELHVAGNFNAAISLLKKAVRLDERYAETHYRLGRVLFDNGQKAPALSAFERARDEDICPLRILPPMSATLREVVKEAGVPMVDFEALISRHCQQSYGHSIPGFELFYDHVHPTIDAHKLLALELFEALQNTGLLSKATRPGKDHIARASSIVHSRLDTRARALAFRNLAKVLSWAGKTHDAVRLAKQSLSLSSTLTSDDMNEISAENLFILGSYAMDKRDWFSAESYLSRSIELASDFGKSHNNLGLVLVKLGQINEAIKHYQRAIEIDNEHVNAHFNLANAYYRIGEYMPAARHYKQVLQSDPEDLVTLHHLAETLVESGMHEQSLVYYRNIVSLTPGDSQAHYDLARVLHLLGKQTEALNSYKRVLELESNHAETHFHVAKIYESQGDLDKAYMYYRRAIELKPGWSEALSAFKQLMNKQG